MLVQVLAFAQQIFTCLLHLYSGCYANIFILILFHGLVPQFAGYVLADIVQRRFGCSFIKKQPLIHVLRAVHILMENLLPLVSVLDGLRHLPLIFKCHGACTFFC